MLPEPALDALDQNIDYHSMGDYIRLSQINRKCRQFFLSDKLWAKFDVYQVRDAENHYTYKGYTLRGIAAHYMNYLSTLDRHCRNWHLDNTKIPVSWPRADGSDFIGPLYSEMNVLCSLWVPYPPPQPRLTYTCSLSRFIRNVDKYVWQLYWSYPDNSAWAFRWSTVTHRVESKDIYIKLMHKLRNSPPARVERRFENDWDVNMKLAELGWIDLCSNDLRADTLFMMEAIRINPMNFAASKLACEKPFIEEAFHQIPGLIEFVQEQTLDRNSILFSPPRPRFTLAMYPANVQNRASFVRAALSRNILLFEDASAQLRDDEATVLFGLSKVAEQLIAAKNFTQFVSQRLLNDKKFILEAIQVTTSVYWGIPTWLQNDPEVKAHFRECGIAHEKRVLKLQQEEGWVPSGWLNASKAQTTNPGVSRAERKKARRRR